MKSKIKQHHWGEAPEFYGPFHHHKERLICRQLKSYLPVNALVLEAGCGSGSLALKIARRGHRVKAVDLSPGFVRFVRKQARRAGLSRQVKVRQANLFQLPYQDGTFDAVVSADVIEHLADDQKAVGELFRVLRGGGWLLVCVPAGRRLFGRADKVVGHLRRYEKKTLIGLVTNAGFSVEKCFFFGGRLSSWWWYHAYGRLVEKGQEAGRRGRLMIFHRLPSLLGVCPWWSVCLSQIFRLESVRTDNKGIGLILVAKKP